MICLGFNGFSQANQDEYQEAKRQFQMKNYSAAMMAFSGLSEDADFGTYATFYYGLSAYKKKEYQTAKDAWKQVIAKDPKWKQRKEVNYWLTEVSAKTKAYEDFFKYSKEFGEVYRKQKAQEMLGELGVDELSTIYKNNRKKEIAEVLFSKIMKQPASERDATLLKELASKHGLKEMTLKDGLPLVKKEKYAVAVLFPFMYESLDNPHAAVANSIIMDLYQGMNLAQDELKFDGVNLKLLPFDTKKSEAITQSILQKPSLKNADIIIGPLYEEPFRLASQFSSENKVPMINPVTSKDAYVKTNPYLILTNSCHTSQGVSAAKYAKKTYAKNKNALVFYETLNDRVIAEAYKEELEQEGFNVLRFEELDKSSALEVQHELTDTYEFTLSNKFTYAQIDSIASIPGRYVKVKPSNQVQYENRYYVKPDSIGHIFVATSNNTIANSFINIVETRPDTIGLIGLNSWLDFRLLSYDQFQRLGIRMVAPHFFDKKAEAYQEFEEMVITKLKVSPSKFHLIGYELVMQLGKWLKKNGKYIQRGMGENHAKIKGILMNDLRYDGKQDNQLAPIIRVENYEIVKEN